MCRNDIRNYRDEPGLGASASAEVSDIYSRIMDNSRNFMNMEINNINNDSVTFSYDLPSLFNNASNYDEEQIYRDIINTVAGVAGVAAASSGAANDNGNGNGNDNGNDNGDYMDMD